MRFLLTATFSLITCLLFAQNVGNTVRYYGDGSCYEEGVGIIPTNNGYLLSAAYNCAGGAQNWDSYLLQLSPNGDTLATTKGLPFNGKLIQTTDGNRVFAGGDVASNVYDTVRITKVAQSGTVIWSADLYLGSCKTFVSDVTEVFDGLLITGYYGTGNCAAPNFDAYVAKLDFGGQVQWVMEVDGNGDEQLNAVKQMPDGRIAAFGWTTTNVNNNQNDYLLVFLDADGKLIDRKQFGNEYANFGYGLELSYSGGLITNGYGVDMEVYELDAFGKIINHQEFGLSCGSSYFKVKQTLDGGYAFLGTEDVNGQCTAVFMKMDSSGKVLYSKNWNARLRSFTENADGGFALTGYARYLPDAVVILFDSTQISAPTKPSGIVADSNLLSNPKDQNVQALLDSMNINTSVNENRMVELSQVKLYPNPANNYINMEFSNPDNQSFSLEIYSVAGQLVDYYEDITGDRFRIDLSEMPNGPYTYKLGSSTGFFTGKFIVSGK